MGGNVFSGSRLFYFSFLSSKELVNTDTELSAMAAPAITGFNNPTAAKGIPKQL